MERKITKILGRLETILKSLNRSVYLLSRLSGSGNKCSHSANHSRIKPVGYVGKQEWSIRDTRIAELSD